MGLFSRKPPEPLDPSLAELLTGYEERHEQKALKALGRAQKLILPVTKSLRDGEELRMLVIDAIFGNFLLITNQRSIEIQNWRNKEIEHADVAETDVGATSGTGNTVVSIESHSARLDYRPTDTQRYEKIIVFTVVLPRTGVEIRSEVDSRVRST